MKMRYKLLAAFTGALSISIVLFLFFCYYSLHNGFFSGISREDMKQALAQGEQLFSETGDEVTVLQELEAYYEDMDFA